jgi:uncharacterized protein (TIGR03437 family)
MRTQAIILIALCFSIGQLAAQTADGDYHFVDLALRQGGSATAMLGTLQVQGAAAAFSARRAQGPDPAQTITGQASWATADSFSSTLSDLAGSNLRVRLGQGGVFVGSGQSGDHELLLALRKATAAPVLSGRYSGVYLRFNNGASANAETCQVVFDVAGAAISSIAIVNHSAALDDVNRFVSQGATPFSLAADGTGTIRFADGAAISGTMNVAASGDGGLIVGTNLSGTTRDLLIVVRDLGDATESSLTGTYWIAELGGESPFAQPPSQQSGGLQLSSADGSLFSFGTGAASIAESVRLAGQSVELSTSVRYRMGSGAERMLGRSFASGVRNLAVAADLGVLVASWTGRAGDLTLEHGLLLGVRAPAIRLAALNAGSSAPVTAAVAPGTLVSLYGTGLAATLVPATGFPLPTDLGGVRVLVNGVAAGLLVASPGQINFQIPYGTLPGTATVEVQGGASVNSLTIAIAAQSPGVFATNQAGTGAAIATHADYQLVTGQNPARPNETLLVFLTGLGAVTPAIASGAAAEGALRRVADPGLQVLFNGIPGRVDFAGLSPGFAGLYQINVVVPDSEAVDGTVATGVRTSTAYSDLTDVPVLR